MKRYLFAVMGLATAFIVSAKADTVVYGGTASGTAYTYAAAQHYLEDFTVSASGQLSTVAISIDYAGLTGSSAQQAVQLEFYTGVNTDGASTTNALGTATNIFGVIFTLPTATNGDSVYTLSLAPLNQTLLAGTNYGLAVSLIQSSTASSGYDYSDFANGRFSNVAPSPGTNVLGNKVWLDGVNGGLSGPNPNNSFDNVFTGDEQSALGQGAANTRLNISIAPEPSALVFSAIAGCVMLGSFFRFRRASFAA